jgi:protein O-GlcNAc transferase
MVASRHFIDWMQAHPLSLAVTTYQSARLMLLGVDDRGQLSGFERVFERAMGLWATSDRIFLGAKYQVWQLSNVLAEGQRYQGYDRLFVPRIGYTTGDLDIHDLAVAAGDERPVFVSTLLNCLATVSDRHSCRPLWRPPFVSGLVNEDRCHLNGLAMVDGRPRYVTACSRSDVVDGWRDCRADGGCVIDIASDRIVAAGLSMPHSPRFHRGRLWLLNSGTGELGFIGDAGDFRPLVFCPGFLRGLAFVGDLAIVGLSKPRGGDGTFCGLPLDAQLAARRATPSCGLMVIDLERAAIVHWLRLEGEVTEIYDVQVLPGVRHPMALGFHTDEIARLLTLEPVRSDPGAVTAKRSQDSADR